MKTLSITMENTLYAELRAFVCSGQISYFVSEAVRKHMTKKQTELAAQYIEAEEDEERLSDIDLWRVTDAEGWK